ncbi:MAG: hypothetical protein EOP55_13365, partial [Sphingobacteriales bacterium]
MQNPVFILRNSPDNSQLRQLRDWAKKRSDTGGVLQVLADEKVMFEDVKTGEQRMAEAGPKDKRPFKTATKSFSTTAYEWAG